MTVLVIDYDLSACQIIDAALSGDGYHCLTAKNTQEADLVMETVPVDGITLDLEIPGCRPMEWLQEIAILSPDMIRRTVVIAGKNIGDADRKRIRETGAGLLLKPFTTGELKEALCSRIGTPAGSLEKIKPPAGAFRPIPDDPE